MRIRLRRAAMLAVAVVVSAGCTSTIGGSPRPAEGDQTGVVAGGLPVPPEQEQTAAQFAAMRNWDVCAMHDIAAATRITGYRPDALHPTVQQDDCELTVKATNGAAEWLLTLKLSPLVVIDDAAVPIIVDGIEMPQVDSVGREEQCAYGYPIKETGDANYGIEVKAYHLSPDRPPCDVAREYLTALLPRLADPPLRSAGLTTPTLALASLDPCTVVAELLAATTGGAELTLQNTVVDFNGPLGCKAEITETAPNGARTTMMDVEFGVSVGAPEGSATVAGRPADLGSSVTGRCRVEFQATDLELVYSPDGQPYVEVMVLDVPDCDTAQQLAERAATLVRPSAPANGGTNVQPIGDLDPPPGPHDVGAPFDPCTVVGWAGYPPHLQPNPPREPSRMPVGQDDPFRVGCKFNHKGLFSSLVWGHPNGVFTADPAARPGSIPTRFGEKPGIEQVRTVSGQPSCYSAVQLSNGIAAMSTGEPGGEPCAVNRAVLSRLAAVVD